MRVILNSGVTDEKRTNMKNVALDSKRGGRSQGENWNKSVILFALSWERGIWWISRFSALRMSTSDRERVTGVNFGGYGQVQWVGEFVFMTSQVMGSAVIEEPLDQPTSFVQSTSLAYITEE